LIKSIYFFVFFLLLDFIYTNIIYPNFNYLGFDLITSFTNNVVCYSILFITVISYNSIKVNPVASFFLFLFLAFAFIPHLILLKYGTVGLNITFGYLIIFYIIILLQSKKFGKTKFLKIKLSDKHLLIISLILALPFFLHYGFELNFNNLMLIDVYETRAKQSANSNMYLNYTYSLLASVFFPIVMIKLLSKKKYILLSFFIILYLYFFLVGAHKQLLFNLFLIFIFFNFKNKNLERNLLFVFSFFLILSIIEFLYFKTFLITNFFTRRVLFLPTLLDKYYFDFFETNSLFWSDSWLKFILDYPYQYGVPYVIAGTYLNDWNMSSNNGIVSDGFSQAGYLGILINAVFIGYILRYLNSNNIEFKYYGIIFIFLINILSATLSTVLITHGGLLLIILSYKLKKTN
jgi:hypothetical protein